MEITKEVTIEIDDDEKEQILGEMSASYVVDNFDNDDLLEEIGVETAVRHFDSDEVLDAIIDEVTMDTIVGMVEGMRDGVTGFISALNEPSQRSVQEWLNVKFITGKGAFAKITDEQLIKEVLRRKGLANRIARIILDDAYTPGKEVKNDKKNAGHKVRV